MQSHFEVAELVLTLLARSAASKAEGGSGHMVAARTNFMLAAMTNHMTLDECAVVEERVLATLQNPPEHAAESAVSIFYDFAVSRPASPLVTRQDSFSVMYSKDVEARPILCFNANSKFQPCTKSATEMILHGKSRTPACWGITAEAEEVCACPEGSHAGMCRTCCENSLVDFFRGMQDGTVKSCMTNCARCGLPSCVFRAIPSEVLSHEDQVVEQFSSYYENASDDLFLGDLSESGITFDALDSFVGVHEETPIDQPFGPWLRNPVVPLMQQQQEEEEGGEKQQQQQQQPRQRRGRRSEIEQMRTELNVARNALSTAIQSLDKFTEDKVTKRAKKTRKRAIGKCSNCNKPGHNKSTCPNLKKHSEKPGEEA